MSVSKLKRLGQYWRSWQHFGTPMMLSKAWEKYVVDKKRFRSGNKSIVPFFDTAAICEADIKAPDSYSPVSICYLTHYFFPDKQGGTERFILNLAKEQKRFGNRVRVITLGKRSLDQYSHQTEGICWEEFSYDGIPVTQIRYVRAPRGLYYDEILPEDASMLAFAQEALARYKPDIVHFAYPQPFAAFAAACVQSGIPYCVTLTDFSIFCHYATMVCKDGAFCAGSDEGKKCERRCRTYGVSDVQKRYRNARLMLCRALTITVPSRFVAAVMRQEFPDIPMCVIAHGIGTAFSPSRVRGETKQFVYVGTLSELKGVHLLIDAFRQLKADVTLQICGGGVPEYREQLERHAAGDPRISFSGEIRAEDMPAIYEQADCVVVPSIWYETYNFVVREALACRCLCVASNMGAMPEAIREGRNGFLFEAGNALSLRKALEKAIHFDWSGYSQSAFADPETEAVSYRNIYQLAKVGIDG